MTIANHETTCCGQKPRILEVGEPLTEAQIAEMIGRYPSLAKCDFSGPVLLVECPRCQTAERRIESADGFAIIGDDVLTIRDADAVYQVALATESGAWDVIETFRAASDDAANAYADEHHADREWYVIKNGRNINA